MKRYNNYCRICRNNKHWNNIFDHRVRQMLKEPKDGKRVTVRLTKRIESKLSNNVSQLVLKLLAREAAKGMSIVDDEDLKREKYI